jgi:hypothetical protein
MADTGGYDPHAPQTRFSADWAWWWDGAEWKPAISPDRLWRWDGQRWVPAVVGRPPSGDGMGAGIAITVMMFVGVLLFVSLIVVVVLLTMGNQIANVFSNVVAALGP